MQAHLARGLSAAEAARAVLGEDNGAGADPGRAAAPDRVASAAGELSVPSGRPSTLSTSQPPRQSWTGSCPTSPWRRCYATLCCRTSTELGERWESGTASVVQEHFATNVIRGRLAGLARAGGTGTAPAPS